MWLGIKAWSDLRNGPQATPSLATPAVTARDREVYFRSVLTGLFNPKVALFLFASLPQFVHP